MKRFYIDPAIKMKYESATGRVLTGHFFTEEGRRKV